MPLLLNFRLQHAPPSRGIPAFFHSPPASECLLFAWPKRRHQEKGHPTLTPYAQSLCSRCASLLRGSPTVHPWTDVELAHIVWAILRTFPPQSRRDRGGPNSAHRARQSKSEEQSRRPSPSSSPSKAETCGNWLHLGCARCAVDGPPMQRQRDGGIARRVGAMDCAQFDASPWMDCRRTFGVALRSRMAGARRPLYRGGLLFGAFLLATQKKDTRSPEASEKRQGCRAPKERALNWRSKRLLGSNHRNTKYAVRMATGKNDTQRQQSHHLQLVILATPRNGEPSCPNEF